MRAASVFYVWRSGIRTRFNIWFGNYFTINIICSGSNTHYNKSLETNQGVNGSMKDFEDRFSELQADMISICMEYINERADKIYVYASCEGNIISSKFFYLINNKYVKCNKVNDALEDGDEEYDVSPNRMLSVLNIINDNIEKIETLCKEYNKEMPTEMKLIYNVHSGNFKAVHDYDLVYTNDDMKTANHIADEWFEEVKNNNL